MSSKAALHPTKISEELQRQNMMGQLTPQDLRQVASTRAQELREKVKRMEENLERAKTELLDWEELLGE